MIKTLKLLTISGLGFMVLFGTTYGYVVIKNNGVINTVVTNQVASVSSAISAIQKPEIPESFCYLDSQIKSLEDLLQSTQSMSSPASIAAETKRINTDISKLQAEEKKFSVDVKAFTTKESSTTSPYNKAKEALKKLTTEQETLSKITRPTAAQKSRLTALTALVTSAKTAYEKESGLLEQERVVYQKNTERLAVLSTEIASLKKGITDAQSKAKDIPQLKARIAAAKAKKCSLPSGVVVNTPTKLSSDASYFGGYRVSAKYISDFIDLQSNSNACYTEKDIKEINGGIDALVSKIKSGTDTLKRQLELSKNSKVLEAKMLELKKVSPTDEQVKAAYKKSKSEGDAMQIKQDVYNDAETNYLFSKPAEITKTINDLNQAYYDLAVISKKIASVKGVVCPVLQTSNPTTPRTPGLSDTKTTYTYEDLKNVRGEDGESVYIGNVESQNTSTVFPSTQSPVIAQNCTDSNGASKTPYTCSTGEQVCDSSLCPETYGTSESCEPMYQDDKDFLNPSWREHLVGIPFVSQNICTATGQCAGRWTQRGDVQYDSISGIATIICVQKRDIPYICKDGSRSYTKSEVHARSASCRVSPSSEQYPRQ